MSQHTVRDSLNETPFEEWYNSLPANKQSETRNKICTECGFTKGTFYNYLNGETEVPKLVKAHIAEIAGKSLKKLFPQKQSI